MKRGDILKAWMPLEAAWLLMAIEGPFIAAVIARMADPTLNLAAYGVAFPLGMLFESPIILIMSAATALVKDRESLRRLFRFTLALNGLITAALLLCVLPVVFTALARGLMDLPEAVVARSRVALALLMPWPAAIGFRRFYQGLMIRAGQTRRVAYCTTVRLATMGGSALLLAQATGWPGAWVGCAALSLGVSLEALAARLWASGCLADLRRQEPAPDQPILGYRSIARFYIPLALTSVLALGVNPLVSFFLGHARMPLESLAVMPVVNGFVFIFNTAGLTLQEVAIPLLEAGERARRAIRRFAATLAAGASLLLMLVAFTPLSGVWFRGVSGLTPALAAFAALLLLTRAFGLVGATAAACALVAGRAASVLFLMARMKGVRTP